MRWSHGRHTFVFGVPQTAREVVSFRTREKWSLEQPKIVQPTDAMDRLVDWVGRYTKEVLLGQNRVGWAEYDAHERAQALSHWLPASALGEYAGVIIGEASLPREMYEAALRHFGIGLSGGCSCRVCRGDAEHQDRGVMGCKYRSTPDALWLLLGECATVLASVSLSDPYHLYQIHEALQVARYRVVSEREKKSKETEEMHAKLKARGLM